jgi:hypothetical protein
MMNDKDFYRELGHVPDLPGGLYENVRAKTRSRTAFSRAVLAAAALVIISAGTAGVMLAGKANNSAVSPEAVAELQTVHNYLSGTDLDREYESYALYEGESQE